MDTTASFLLPPQSSTIAGSVDWVFYFILAICVFFFFLVIGLAAYFIIKYRRKGPARNTPDISHNTALELLWTIGPIIIVIVIFIMGFTVYLKMNVAPKDALEIKVTAQRWLWSFSYPNGLNSVNELVVPAGKPIRLLMSSTDVIHDFFVPDFRIKMDVLPNRYTMAWFEAPNPGVHVLTCAEYCGRGHSQMLGKIRVVSQVDYDKWIETSAGPSQGQSPEQYGASLYQSRRCVTCHSIDGSPNVGPTFKGVFGSNVTLQGGVTVKADENYIRESILDPEAKVVAGFSPVMPTFQGLLNSRDIDALIAFIKSQNNQENQSTQGNK
jgi:cytochrome c oxidase subunit II